SVREEVSVDLIGRLRATETVDDDPADVSGYDDPVEQCHCGLRTADCGSIADCGLRERIAEPHQRDDHEGFDDDDLDIVARHSAALRSASRRSAFVSALVAPDHHPSSASSCCRAALAARAVSSGAGPPNVLRISTK